MRTRRLWAFFISASIAWLLAATQIVSVAPAETAAKPVDFNRDIRPILSDTCFTCHGPDEKQRMANMRLDETAGLFADRGGYRIIVPGDSAHSKIYQKISSKDESFRMPPVYSGRTLTPKQIELIKEWIDQGAKWATQWSLVSPQRPALPEVKEKSWPRNPIDNFVLARLQTEGLKPSPEADQATLLRRLYFDLTGLPPTPAEIDSFLADHSADAYEKRVDQLLASPRYGERMAMPWLDLARYADTHGFHIDPLRNMWAWRDWVIQAFNANMPYDEFTIEQIAGDLLPNATREQKIASGFNRNHEINFEGGAIPEEYHVEYVIDRVSTTSTTWLGLTMGCARCHDHKFDPIKQKDFYRFSAFFNTVPERGLDGYTGNAVPVLPLPSHEEQEHLDSLNVKIASLLAALPEKQLAVQRNEWQKTALASIPQPSSKGLVAYYPLDGDLKDASGNHHDGKEVRGQVVYEDGIVGKNADFSPETEVSFGNVGEFDRSAPFALGFWVRASTVTFDEIIQKHGPGDNWQGWEVAVDAPSFTGRYQSQSYYFVRLAGHWPDAAIEVRTKDRIETAEQRHLLINYDGRGKAAGISLYVDGKPVPTEVVKDSLTGSFANSAPMEVGNKNLGTPFQGRLDDLRVYDRVLTAHDAEDIAIRVPARSLLEELAGRPAEQIKLLQPEKEPEEADVGELAKAKSDAEKAKALEAEHQTRLSEYFLSYGAVETDRKLYAQLKAAREEKADLIKAIPTVMIMAEMKKPRDTFILGRGQYDNHLEKVAPGVPAFLPPMPPGLPMNRLGLAKWLVDPANPLTARVAVNHFWQNYFGTGIVKTAEDFGSQGEQPSHPQLLDWLATEFVRTGWNVKAMQRLILTSATYRQSSRVTPELVERDPENRLLARGPRFRLPAEIIRDNALAISGLLDERIGGPSVSPYQPKGLWEEMGFGQGYTGQYYVQSTGRDLYRRSMYTIWKRTVPPPAMTTFDAPDREKCTARRTVTNTPLQALELMNDPTYIESARFLAARVITQGGKTTPARINYAFRLATGREPDAQERAVLVEAVQQALADYRQHRDQAVKLLSVGDSRSDPKLNPQELAAWTTVASIILNLDETITKQ